MFFSKIKETPKCNQQRGPLRTTPFMLPSASEQEEMLDVICALKETAPYEYITLGGITFHKVIYPSERSYVDNKDKQYSAGYLVLKLSKKQIDALLQEASKRQMVSKHGLIPLSEMILITLYNDFKVETSQLSLEKYYDNSSSKSGSGKKNQQ